MSLSSSHGLQRDGLRLRERGLRVRLAEQGGGSCVGDMYFCVHLGFQLNTESVPT